MRIKQVVVLAGGLATRMHPLTISTPKSLLMVAGRPFIEHQLNLISKNGITSVVLCLGHLGTMIEQHIGTGEKYGLEIIYSYDGATSRGTGGAITNADQQLHDNFFVLYGDSYLPNDWRIVERAYWQTEKQALMTVYKNDDKFEASNVQFDGQKIIQYSKVAQSREMKHIDYGLGIFSRDVFKSLALGTTFDLADVYANLLATDNIQGFEVRQRFFEIGSAEGLNDTEKFLLEGQES